MAAYGASCFEFSKVVELAGGQCVINGATLSSYNNLQSQNIQIFVISLDETESGNKPICNVSF